MSQPVDFVPIRLTCADERAGRAAMRGMLGRNWWRLRGRASWAGFAAERALRRALAPGIEASEAPTLEYDLDVWTAGATLNQTARVEVKTRTVTSGWTDPARFQWLTIPTHDGREPIKAVDLVWFCWFTGEEPWRVWALGYLRGPDEFKRRATFYREGEALPRGGWAKAGGAWSLDVRQLRPFPRGLFTEE